MKFNLNIKSKVTSNYLSAESKVSFYNKFLKTVNDESIGFFKLTDDHAHIEKVNSIYEIYKERKNFVQIGIGGSALGPQMLIEALGKKDKHFIFLDNTDADDIEDKLSEIDLKDSLFYVVSKSGGTAETIASFIICYNKLLSLGVKEKEMTDYFVFSTDPNSGELRKLADENGYKTLEVPTNIGGRFSVLTSVGLLPAVFAGIQIEELFKGANDTKRNILENKENSTLIELGAYLMSLYNIGIDQTILMPYSSKLKSLSHWFVQLWGESLGKIDKEGNAQGLTPIPAFGATDQHSQMQLFMEGKNDKFLIILEVENRNANFNLKSPLTLASAQKLSDYDINSLIKAQLNGTLKALADRDRNTLHIQIDKNNEFSMGSLVMFFECLTVLMGHYLNIDPFNQPGVELGKKYAFEYLNSLGHTSDQ